jgi:hypothetical protein
MEGMEMRANQRTEGVEGGQAGYGMNVMMKFLSPGTGLGFAELAKVALYQRTEHKPTSL